MSTPGDSDQPEGSQDSVEADQDRSTGTVLIAGGSGYLGSALVDRLAELGLTTRRLVRRPPNGENEFIWDPTHGEADEAAFEGVDAVINLCGAGVFDRPWSAARKAELTSSRVEPAGTLAAILARRAADHDHRPTLIQGTAIGWYGVRPSSRAHVEGDPAGTDFLAELVEQWEAATQPAADAGLRVTFVRTAVVLDADARTFKLLKVPFSLGMGAVLGSGQQHFAIISLRDWVDAVVWLLDHHDAHGPYNLTIPTPVSNAEFSKELANQLKRPLLITAPERVLRQLLGPMADQLFGDQHVLPERLVTEGFRFNDPTVTEVVATALAD